LHYLRMLREAALFSDQNKQKVAEQIQQKELALMKAVDIATVISAKELEEIKQVLPEANVKLLPYARRIRGTDTAFSERRDIVFVGSYQHMPNVDAIQYFVDEIMPLLRESLPGVCLHVVGSHPTDAIRALVTKDIVAHGCVENLEPFLDGIRVNLAPLRYGAGIKGKIGSAMAIGLPTVATAIAAEGMSLTDGENILIADGAREYADAVVRLYNDEALWNRLSRNGLVFAEKTWGAEAAWKTLAEILNGELGFYVTRTKNALTLYGGQSRFSATPSVFEHLPKICSSLNPLISVIIPIYGKIEYTLRCLASITKHMSDTAFEIIVVDDCSPDDSAKLLGQIQGIRLLRNNENQGCIRACNRGASAAVGEYLLFLSNDTEVTSGWMDELLRTFHEFPDAGYVGSKLIYPNGTLLEAGGIVWRDGSASRYGKFDNPGKSVYNYVRESDYCSSASILIPKKVFERLEGFDERYAPAYCEDRDFAFKVRKIGLKVYYQPRSVVIHYEGVTLGRDETTGLKAHQVINQKSFFEKWQEVLDSDHYANGSDVIKARDRARHKTMVLVIDHYIPQPDRDAGSRTMVQWVALFQGHGVDVKFWPANLKYFPDYTERLQQKGIEVVYSSEYDGPEFENWIKENGRHFDHVLLSRPHVAVEYISLLRSYSKAIIHYYGHDIHYLRIQEERKFKPQDVILAEDEIYWRDMEHKVWSEVDKIYYLSSSEVEHVRSWLGASGICTSVHTIPCFAFDRFCEDVTQGLAKRSGILFVAGFGYPPNVDGAIWFVSEILPLIHSKRPDVHVYLVGSNPSEEVLRLASPQITVTGFVSDDELADYYAQVRVAVAPLRFGAGVKGKVIESLRFGLPMITTSIGAQGLTDIADRFAVADEPQMFAEHVLRYLGDDDIWVKQANAAVMTAKNRYSREALFDAIAQDFDLLPREGA
jgi:GT2 family glycosyltransferase